MIEYLEAYCDINEIDLSDRIVAAGSFIEQNASMPLYTFSRRGWLLKAFYELIDEKRDLESFMMLGDVLGQESVNPDGLYQQALEQLVMGFEAGTQYDKSMIILERAVLVTNDPESFVHVTQLATTRGSKIFMI